jgi:Ca2+-binding RTX toxin-like protein
VRIVASLTNPASVGQTRLITASTATTLTVDSPWSVLPDNAQYEISLFDGLALPNVHVRIYSQQKAEIVVHQNDANLSVAEDTNGTVAQRIANKAIEGIGVRLSQAPQNGETVTVNLNGQGQLSFLDASFNPITHLTFDQNSWHQPQTVYVVASDPLHVVEGFREIDLALTAASSLSSGSAYAGVSDTRTVTISDTDSPGVRVLQPTGSTNVAEFTDGEFGTNSGDILAAGFPAYNSYQVVLTKALAPGETVTVNAVSQPTRTTRGGGVNGLVSFTQTVLVSTDNANFGNTASLTFTAANWDVPRTVYVHAVDNQRVDGTDTTVFAQTLQEVNRIRGPLIIHGGAGADRTGLLERPAVLLPYERDVKPHIGAVVSATEAAALTPATVTINPSGLTVAALASLGIAVGHADPVVPADLVHLSLQVTDGSAKNKVRIITGAVDNGNGTWTLTLSHPWLSPFTGDPANPTDPSLPDATSHYTLAVTNPNLLADERDQSNLLQVYDGDNPSSYNDPALGGGTNPQAVGQLFYDTTFQTGVDAHGSPTFLNMFRITGLGMGGDRVIGGANQPGGIAFDGLQNIDINLGSGNNHFIVANTPAGAVTRLNTGGGDDLVDVKSVAGHTFINTGAGNDTVNVHNDGKQLKDLLGLLTVSGDVPQATVLRLVNGSPARGTTINAVNDIQQVTVDATGGTFALSLDNQSTGQLPYNVSAAALESALVGLTNIGQTNGHDNVSVTKAGNVYRIEFVNGLAGQAIDLLATHDLNLTNGVGTHDTLNVDDSGTVGNTVGLLTSSTLTGLSTQQVNTIETIFVNASEGHFTLSFGSPANVTAALPFDVSAAALQAALQGLAGIKPGDVAVSRNDKVIEVRFQGNLANSAVAPLVATPGADLLLAVEPTGGGTELAPFTKVTGTVTVTCRVTGTSATQVNDMQAVTVNATAGTFTLSLLGGTIKTGPIAYDASADAVQAALQAAFAVKDPAEQFQIDVTVNRYGNVYLIGFQGKLRRVNNGFGVDELQADATNLTGTVSVATRTDGLNYYGVENLNIDTSTGNVVFSVQGTTAGSNGFAGAGGVAVTNVTFHGGASSTGQAYVSSNADLDFASAKPAFDFLSGNLNDVKGALNLNTGSGRHRLMISNEGSPVGATDARITDTAANLPNTPASLGLDPTAEIWISGLAPAGISYQADRTNGNFFDGVTYWTGSGDDKVLIDGTHQRPGGRTMTLLNTGLGNDNVTVNLTAGQDGFFALNTSGGSQSPNPAAFTGTVRDDDTVDASRSTLPLVIFGGWGNDNITGSQGNNIILGDFGRVQYLDPATGAVLASLGAGGHGDFTTSQIVDPTWIYSRDKTIGGNDMVLGGSGEDILVGGAGNDTVDGGAADDLIFGDAVQLQNRLSGTIASPVYNISNPRFQALKGTQMYDTSASNSAGADQVDGTARGYRDPNGTYVPSWASWQIKNLYQTKAIQDGTDPNFPNSQKSFGNDYIAGGAGNDEIFGQLGNDTIQGDGSTNVALTGGKPVFAFRDANNALQMNPTFAAPTDGDDYIEGGGGNDTIFGGLGQDDIIGGSSDLFSLTTPAQRPDGSDMIFGGTGTDIGRNDPGDTSATGHARDSDTILGDNGDIFRLVGVNGNLGGGGGVATFNSFLAFNYDNYTNALPAAQQLKIIPRATRMLDYTPGGPDFNAAAAANDIGAADEIHGGGGDDFIYGEKGNDVLFGDGQNDVIVGGYGADWISGGTGDDGVLGDDGRVLVSRNSSSFGEPLYGIAAIPAANINQLISNSSTSLNGVINVDQQLKYTVDLTPQNLQPNQTAGTAPDPLFRPLFANDIIYGGWGNDALHGGAGDDAISGAEAPVLSYTNSYDANGNQLNATPIESDFFHPFNPGNVLGYQTSGPNATKFALYDANDPLRTILLTPTGALSKTGTGLNWILNFDQTEGPIDTNWVQGTSYPGLPTDGDDHIFGDLGNDWLVGGTGRDVMYGGWGDDLLNADDNLNSPGTVGKGGTFNPSTDTNPSYEDLAFGGAGRDVLIANTNGDRLLDWSGEFNSYWVPYAQYGSVSVSRMLSPAEPAFLYALSQSEGADQTLAAQYGSDPTRNGEPFGELGLVTSQDAAWGDQKGGSRDPQPGNTGGAKVDLQNNPGTAGNKPIYETAPAAAPAAAAAVTGLLTQAQLDPVVAQAKALWVQALGAGDSHLAVLNDVQVQVGNLPDQRLGVTLGHLVLIDSNAAGYGWFVSGTTADLAHSGRMDLLSVVAHELGNAMGFAEDAAATDKVTSPLLAVGTRHLPEVGQKVEFAPALAAGGVLHVTALPPQGLSENGHANASRLPEAFVVVALPSPSPVLPNSALAGATPAAAGLAADAVFAVLGGGPGNPSPAFAPPRTRDTQSADASAWLRSLSEVVPVAGMAPLDPAGVGKGSRENNALAADAGLAFSLDRIWEDEMYPWLGGAPSTSA